MVYHIWHVDTQYSVCDSNCFWWQLIVNWGHQKSNCKTMKFACKHIKMKNFSICWHVDTALLQWVIIVECHRNFGQKDQYGQCWCKRSWKSCCLRIITCMWSSWRVATMGNIWHINKSTFTIFVVLREYINHKHSCVDKIALEG